MTHTTPAPGPPPQSTLPDVLETLEARRALLTAQETQVAKLAATGLSNREIAARLLLSHRTVSAHLYRIFPKLGITSRVSAALRDALTRSSPGA